jgi:hypothetical protein
MTGYARLEELTACVDRIKYDAQGHLAYIGARWGSGGRNWLPPREMPNPAHNDLLQLLTYDIVGGMKLRYLADGTSVVKYDHVVIPSRPDPLVDIVQHQVHLLVQAVQQPTFWSASSAASANGISVAWQL